MRLTIGLLTCLLPGLASAAIAHTMDCTKPPYGDSQDNYQQFILDGEVASKGNLKQARAIAAAEAVELQSACNAKYLHRGTARYATMGLAAAALKNYSVTRIAAYAMGRKNGGPQKVEQASAEGQPGRINRTPRTEAARGPEVTPGAEATPGAGVAPGAQVAPRSVTVQQFQKDGLRFASEGSRLLISGAYIGQGYGGYLYASSAAIQIENTLGTSAPSIRLLTDNASERARTRFALCSTNAATAQNGCLVTIEGVATTCKMRFAFGERRNVACIDVRDIQP